MANCLNRPRGSTWCAKVYIPCWQEEAWLCTRFCDVPLFSRHATRFGRHERKGEEEEGGGLPLLADLHLVFFYLLNSEAPLDVVRGEGLDNYWKPRSYLPARKIMMVVKLTLDAARVWKRREHRGGKSFCGRNEGKLGLREDKNTFLVFSVEGEERGRTFRHFITRLSRVSYLLTFVDREPGCTRKKRRRACIRLSEFLFSPPVSSL